MSVTRNSTKANLNIRTLNGSTWTKMKRLVIHLVESAHTVVRPDPLVGLQHDICESEMASPTFRIWQVARVAWFHCGWYTYSTCTCSLTAWVNRRELVEVGSPYFLCTLVYNIRALKMTSLLGIPGGTRWRSCLMHSAASPEVAGSIPDMVIGTSL
jgi:hypothetical protein